MMRTDEEILASARRRGPMRRRDSLLIRISRLALDLASLLDRLGQKMDTTGRYKTAELIRKGPYYWTSWVALHSLLAIPELRKEMIR